jgi:hypothetical protein
LLVVRADDHAAGTEEQQRFKERVRQQMKLPRSESARAERHHHETQL